MVGLFYGYRISLETEHGLDIIDPTVFYQTYNLSRIHNVAVLSVYYITGHFINI